MATLECDDELRKRILYVGGDGERTKHDIEVASGLELDQWAWRFNLRRRKLP